ncbi:MAG TPA: catalase [Acidimicrobiales bacterium]|nr:catalase [Acidimicrobiales bacterium]
MSDDTPHPVTTTDAGFPAPSDEFSLSARVEGPLLLQDHSQVEQAAFEPANMVPGIAPSPDEMLQGRLFGYPDTHRYRIGPNYLQLPVNQPLVPVHDDNRDGQMNVRIDGDPVCAPNSYGRRKADPDRYPDPAYEVTGEVVRTAYHAHKDDKYRRQVDADLGAKVAKALA